MPKYEPAWLRLSADTEIERGVPISSPVVTVILCVRDAATTVRCQLEALASQECGGVAWELVVVDNGSTDGTLTIVAEMLPRLPNVRIEDASDKVGIAHARNVGCRAAAGDLLLFCDGDDEVAPGWIAAMVSAAGSADILGGALHRERLNRAEWLTYDRTRTTDLQIWTGFLSFASGANCGIRRSVFHALGGFDESYRRGAEDTNFSWRAQLEGWAARFVPDAVVHYRERTTLRGLTRQFYGYGAQDPHLFRDFRALGMPASRWRKGLKFWARLVVFAPRLLSTAAGRRQWVRWAGRGAGRVIGSIRWRALYL